MNTHNFSSFWVALGILALVVAMFGAVSNSQADEVDDAVAKAVAYLNTQGDEPAKTMALAAAGETVDISYLKDFSGSDAISYAKPIMAIVSAGENPATYPNEDSVAKLKSFANNSQLGGVDQINDDIWGILALVSAGVPESDPIIQNSGAFILSNQNNDGGWAWNAGGGSDTNDTAVAIMALLEAGVSQSDSSIQNAISYLKKAQNDDGGFPYDPQGEFGTDSDGNSSAWVIMALNKIGESAAEPITHLLSLQDEDGGFWWMAPPAEFNNKAPTADAVIALVGKSFPVAKMAPPPPPEEEGDDSEVFFRIVGSQEEICRGTVQAETAIGVVLSAAEQCGYTYDIQETSFGPYLAAINEDKAEGLNGWMYAVDNEIPSIGAADYTLSGGERVVWFYGEFGDEPPAFGQVSDSVSLSVEVVRKDGGGVPPGEPEVGFSVEPSSLAFGQIEPGKSATKQLMLTNEGRKNLTIEVEVEGEAVFHFLKIEDVLWNMFETLLAAGEKKNVQVELAVPSQFSSFGQKQGRLILWGTGNE